MGGKEEGWIDYLPGETVMSIKKDNPRKPLSILPGNNKGSNKQVIICFHCHVLNLILTLGLITSEERNFGPAGRARTKPLPLQGTAGL